MDWYLGSNIDDFVVPKDQELYDRLPSPESWWKWGINTSEDSEFCNRRFGLDAKWNEEQLNCNGQIPSSQVDMDCFLTAKDLFSCSSINDRLLDESIHQSDLSCDQSVDQLDGLAGIEQMDEIFLYSVTSGIKILMNACRNHVAADVLQLFVIISCILGHPMELE